MSKKRDDKPEVRPHTPSPWIKCDTFTSNAMITNEDKTTWIADLEIADSFAPISTAEREGNERLILACPEMYAALKAGVDRLETLLTSDGIKSCRVRKQMRDALRKAEEK